jgi:putative tryptophan/tyrosine transport system substrate-binding protein
MTKMLVINSNNINRYKNKKIYTIIFNIFLLCLFFLICCSQPKVYRVGILSGIHILAETADSFKERMTELGYIEGENIIYDVHDTDFDMDLYDQALKKFVKDKVDLIFVFPTEAAMQAKAITKDTGIPVVFSNAYTESTGLINSVQSPGKNITGIRWPGPEIAIKSFTVIQELVPRVKRILVPYQKGYPIVESQLKVLGPVVATAGIKLIEIPASNTQELEVELHKLTGLFNGEAVQLLAEPLMATSDSFAAVSKFAARHHMLIGGTPVFEGDYQSVFGFIPDVQFQGRQAANFTDKIFNGTPAGKILVSTAPYLFYFNYQQAQKLGLEVKEDFLSQADAIIR